MVKAMQQALIILSAVSCSALRMSVDTEPTFKAASGSASAEEETKGGRAYITLVEGQQNLMYASVMAKSMQMLGHAYPNVFMVRADSNLVPRFPALQKAMQRHGWNVKFEIFDPVDIPQEVRGLPNWKEAWQRMSLYKLDPAKYDRFAHLDADTLVLQNLDQIMDNSSAPTFARRMGGCTSMSDIDTDQPITNFFLGQPDMEVYQKIQSFLRDQKSDESMLDDGSVLPGLHPHRKLLRPEDLFYYDCMTHNNAFFTTDVQLQAHNKALPNGIRVLHLGIPGRADAERALREQSPVKIAKEAEARGQPFLARTISRWYELYSSKDVQEVMAAGRAALPTTSEGKF